MNKQKIPIMCQNSKLGATFCIIVAGAAVFGSIVFGFDPQVFLVAIQEVF